MRSSNQDYQYWISRKVKISEEYNELRRIKKHKLQQLEQQQKIKEENTLKIEEFKQRIAELKDQINDSRQSIFNISDSTLSITAPVYSSRKKPLLRQITKEFEHNPKDPEDELNDKIFECFLIIGKNSESAEPDILFSFPAGNDFIESTQGRVVGNFIFPAGIKTRKVKENHVISELKLLLNTKVERNGKHFTFSIKYDIERPPVKYKDRANYKKESLYCCCVIVEELIDVDMEGSYIIQPRSYCLVSYYPCFDLLFKILFYAVNSKLSAEKELIDQQKGNY